MYLKPATNDDYGARIEATIAKPTPQPLSHVFWERATILLVSIWYMISQDVGHWSYEEVDLLFWMSFEISQKDVEGDAPDSNYARDSTYISYLIDVYRVFNHLSVYSDFLSLAPLGLGLTIWGNS